jgi:hypothetical protein
MFPFACPYNWAPENRERIYMLCVLGHDHSSIEVKVAEFNETEPYGKRPFHCPDCWQTTRADIVQSNWTLMTIAAAVSEGRVSCKDCFPRVTAS